MDDQVNDALDREIESLLAVEPSPEFVARVRSRVEEETPHTSAVGWHLGVGVALASIALALVAASTTWITNEGASPASDKAAAPTVIEQLPPRPRAAEPERTAAAAVAAESPLPRVTHRPPRARDVTAAERLVPVVNEDDAEDFDALLTTIRGGRIVLTFDESRDSALAAAPVVIEPIVIEPLADVLEGGVE